MNVSVHLEFGLRILVGTLLAGIIGFERDVHGRPAGLKTHVIVGLASATFMVVSTQLWDLQHYHAGQNIALDPSRIAAAVVTGVGFLGGGAILRTGVGVQGLTTAAGLWLVAAIGLCSGGGFYPEAFFVTFLGLFALTALRHLERNDDIKHLVLRLSSASPSPKEIKSRLLAHAVTVREVSYTLGNGGTELVLEMRCPPDSDSKEILEYFKDMEVSVQSVGTRGTNSSL